MTDKLAFIRADMDALAESNLLITLRTMDSPADAWMVVDGRRVLNFCTNNYLGLANHPKMKEAAKRAVDQWGVGPAAVRSIAGTQALHVELERRLAAFKGVEDALYVQSGFLANQAAIAPLVGKEDVIFSDRLNHASIIDGARLSSAKIIVYEHCDPADLEAKIQEHLPNYRRGLLVTDGVFSMDGDIASLDKLTEVADRYGVLTMVDDAHGEGVLGRGGSRYRRSVRAARRLRRRDRHAQQGVRRRRWRHRGQKAHRGLHPPAGAALPLLQRDHPRRHRRLPGGRRSAGGVGGAGGAAVGQRRLLPRRDAAHGLRHRQIADAHRAGDAGRRRPGQAVQPRVVRGGRLRHADRLPNRAQGAGTHPRDEHRRA